jgi:hypothetical protein
MLRLNFAFVFVGARVYLPPQLSIASFYFSGSGLFKGLRAKEIEKKAPRVQVLCKTSQGFSHAISHLLAAELSRRRGFDPDSRKFVAYISIFCKQMSALIALAVGAYCTRASSAVMAGLVPAMTFISRHSF